MLEILVWHIAHFICQTVVKSSCFLLLKHYLMFLWVTEHLLTSLIVLLLLLHAGSPGQQLCAGLCWNPTGGVQRTGNRLIHCALAPHWTMGCPFKHVFCLQKQLFSFVFIRNGLMEASQTVCQSCLWDEPSLCPPLLGYRMCVLSTGGASRPNSSWPTWT